MANPHLEAEAVTARRRESVADGWAEGEIEGLLEQFSEEKRAALEELAELSGPPPLRPGDVTVSDFIATVGTGLSRRAALDRMVKVAAESKEWETLVVIDEGNRWVRVLRKVAEDAGG